MEYNFQEIEKRWQQYWKANKTYKVETDHSRPKFYVLDMFPYPSGAGLHVGHPLGYIASDIYSRYKRLCGFNVLHPMGYDAFGLPAEQFAIETGQHPAVTTENNIKRYREQMDKIGFSYDWDREVRTCEPEYYRWTQWAFIKMFHHWFNISTQKAEPIETLIDEFERAGNTEVKAACNEDTPMFYAEVWRGMTDEERLKVLMKYRLAYLADTMVNWCPALGTVLANDEVKDGISVRGGHPVEQKKMKQWLLRVSAYAKRLLDGLDTIDWTDSLKEMQRNWIGRSEGAEVLFKIQNSEKVIHIFTTRPDTIYGATFMVLAPESEYVDKVTTHEYREKVDDYIDETKKRTERERISETKRVTGQFTGRYAINPFTGQPIPIWISDYVLAGYGTGAIMAVPAHDSRDFAFAKQFNLPIIQVVGGADIESESYDDKSGKMINSGIIDGMEVLEAIQKIISEIEKREIGKRKVNFRLRDAIFSRQRYWGEPFPVYFKNKIAYTLPESELPLLLPEVDAFKPTEKGEPPLGRAKNWHTADGYPLEMSTMPGFAGSSAYYLRYMDPRNNTELVSKEANEYWQDVDLYIGGTEHATGHLIYSRFWNKFLFDLGYVCKDEPFKKLINQGMIQGRSNFVYRVNTRKYAKSVIANALKDNKLGYKFKTDFNFNHEVYDFESEEKRLIIEVHAEKQAKAVYEKHAKQLSKQQYNLMVVIAEEVAENVEKVLAHIAAVLNGNEEVISHFASGEMAYRPLFVSKELLKDEYEPSEIHVDVNIVHNDILDIELFKQWRYEYEKAIFVTQNGDYHCGYAVEKMSKSMYNVVNPDKIVEDYGADTLRLYEMFLGPLEQSKPWDMNGIEGVHKFLRKFWRLFTDKDNKIEIYDEAASKAELKVLHKTIKKIQDDIQRFSFNTAVSAFMICVNELNDLKCKKREILEPLTVLLAPFAPHIAEELWHILGHQQTVCDAAFPPFNETYLVEDEIVYPVAFNGKRRYEINVPADLDHASIERLALQHEKALSYMEGKTVKNVIIVPKRMVNVVLN